VTGGARADAGKMPALPDGRPDVRTGKGTGDGPSTVVTGGTRADGGKMPALQDGRPDGRTGTEAGKTPALHDGRGDKNVGVPGIPVPLDAVPLKFLAGNLKAISERIFPSAKSQENTSGPRPKFEASLPGRQTVRLEAIKNPTDATRTPAIPIERSMGPMTQRLDGQFMLKTGDIMLKGRMSATEQSASKTKLDQPESKQSASIDQSRAKVSEFKNAAPLDQPRAKVPESKHPAPLDQPRAKVPESKHPAPLNQPRAKAPDRPSAPLDQTRTKHAPHAESAEERLLANFELVLEESPARLEAEAAEGTEAPPLPIESLEREDVILPEQEEEVQFDGPIIEDENAPSRYQYTVEPGDTVELVAIKTLNDISLAPLIYQINRDTIPIEMKNGQMVFALKPGTTIWLPFPKEIAAFQQQ
jgi:hypothetical protein